MLKLRIRTVYLAVFAAAVLFRLGALYEFFHSPLAQYANIPGLDMKTHLELGALFARGEGVFALYRLTAALIPQVTGLVLLQCFAGCLIAVLTVFAAFRLFGSRLTALAAGLFAAWYGNAVLYELVTLPETLNVLTALAAFAAVLQARRKQFKPIWCAAAGALLALTATGRPVGIAAVGAGLIWLIWHLYRRKSRRGMAALAIGLMAVWGPVTVWNGLHGWPLPVYGSNFNYAVKVAGEKEMTSWNVDTKPEKVSVLRIAAGFCHKLPKVFSIREIPDNLNYYFLKDRFVFMQIGVPAALLITLGVAGMAVVLLGRNRRGGLLMWWLFFLSIIFAAYYPAGRYRLVLYPYFAVFAGYFCRALFLPGRGMAILAGVLAAALEWGITPQPALIRSADHTAWGMALMQQNAPAEAIDREWMAAVRVSNGGTREMARLLHRLFLLNRTEDARRILQEYPGNDPYRLFYGALLDLGDGRIWDARRKLEGLQHTVPPDVKAQYCYFLGEACMRTGSGRAAAAAYRELLNMARTDTQKKVISEKIRTAEAMAQ